MNIASTVYVAINSIAYHSDMEISCKLVTSTHSHIFLKSPYSQLQYHTMILLEKKVLKCVGLSNQAVLLFLNSFHNMMKLNRNICQLKRNSKMISFKDNDVSQVHVHLDVFYIFALTCR